MIFFKNFENNGKCFWKFIKYYLLTTGIRSSKNLFLGDIIID